MSSGYERRLTALSSKLQNDPGLPLPNSTKSYWQQPPLESVATLQSTTLPSTTDVLIIGSGITGCSVARQLLENDPSIKVTILEAREITSGATGRNGGHIQACPEDSYEELLPSLGLEGTREVMHFTLANVKALLDLAQTLTPELREYSEVRPVEALNVFTDKERFEHFKHTLEAFNRDDEILRGRGKLLDAETCRETYGFGNAVGAYIHPAGAAWPYRLITGLFAEMLQKYPDRFGLEANTPVQSIGAIEGGTYTVQTPRGTIQAKTVVHATNGHAGHLNPGLRKGAIFPARGQMTAQTPTKGFGIQGGDRSWGIEYSIGFDYVTQSARSGEIFLGGGFAQSERNGTNELGNYRDDEQSTLALAHLGGIMNAVAGPGREIQAGVKSAWTGVMGFTGDGVPLVGKLPEEATGRKGSNEWIAAGFNGYGMVNTWLCGKHLADSILGRDQVEKIPQCYVLSTERLAKLSLEGAAGRFLEFLGMD